MEKHTVIAVDIAKVVFEIGVSQEEGRIAQKRRLSRDAFQPFFAQTPPATVVMEACGSAHYWARRLQELGGFEHFASLQADFMAGLAGP